MAESDNQAARGDNKASVALSELEALFAVVRTWGDHRDARTCKAAFKALDEIREWVLSARVALAGLEMLFSREGENAADRFERVADEFYRETGVMRPGKSYPDAMPAPSDEERTRVYEEWVAAKLRAARECMKEGPSRG